MRHRLNATLSSPDVLVTDVDVCNSSIIRHRLKPLVRGSAHRKSSATYSCHELSTRDCKAAMAVHVQKITKFHYEIQS
jgi:hypothetical protein